MPLGIGHPFSGDMSDVFGVEHIEEGVLEFAFERANPAHVAEQAIEDSIGLSLVAFRRAPEPEGGAAAIVTRMINILCKGMLKVNV